jgi:AraC family transcriptional regulator, activator of mtrCDE
VAGQPFWRISRVDLDKLMTTLEVDRVRLSECTLTAGSRLEVARSEHPTIHYGFAGSGTVLVEGEPPIELSAHTLVLIPARRSATIVAPYPRGGAQRTFGGGQGSAAFIPGTGSRHLVGNGEAVLRLACGSFAAVHAAGLDLFASLATPIVETFDAHDQLDQIMIYAMVELASQEVGGGPMSAALLKLVLLSLLRRSLISANPWVERFSVLNDPPIARAFAEMASKPSGQYTVHAQSQSVGLSRSAFMARFAAAFGESPMSVLRRLRMRHAAGLLSANAVSIDQVAMHSGYQSRSSFTRTFRKHYGTDPSAYRAEAKRESGFETGSTREESSVVK